MTQISLANLHGAQRRQGGEGSVGRVCRGTGALSGEGGVSLVPFQDQNAKGHAWKGDKTLDANEARVRCLVCKETRMDVCLPTSQRYPVPSYGISRGSGFASLFGLVCGKGLGLITTSTNGSRKIGLFLANT